MADAGDTDPDRLARGLNLTISCYGQRTYRLLYIHRLGSLRPTCPRITSWIASAGQSLALPEVIELREFVVGCPASSLPPVRLRFRER
jgi:hypothetical protein